VVEPTGKEENIAGKGAKKRVSRRGRRIKKRAKGINSSHKGPRRMHISNEMQRILNRRGKARERGKDLDRRESRPREKTVGRRTVIPNGCVGESDVNTSEKRRGLGTHLHKREEAFLLS